MLSVSSGSSTDVTTVPMPLAHVRAWPERPTLFHPPATSHWRTHIAHGVPLHGLLIGLSPGPSFTPTPLRSRFGVARKA